MSLSMECEYCDRCGAELEVSQIGLCDDCQDDDALPTRFDVIVTRDTTESCAIVIEAHSEAEAIAAAIARSHTDLDLVWEHDDTPNASREHYVTNCEGDL